MIELRTKVELLKIRTPTTIDNFQKLHALDVSFIGTRDYMGIAYFWDAEYKYSLRDCTQKNRIKVHDAWILNGLKLDGISDLHKALLDKICANDSELKRKYGKINW